MRVLVRDLQVLVGRVVASRPAPGAVGTRK
jgi:hypothetical protein